MSEEEIIKSIVEAAQQGHWLLAFSIAISFGVELLKFVGSLKARLAAVPVIGVVARFVPDWLIWDEMGALVRRLFVIGCAGLGSLLTGIHYDLPWAEIGQLAMSSALMAAGFGTLAAKFFPRGTKPGLVPKPG